MSGFRAVGLTLTLGSELLVVLFDERGVDGLQHGDFPGGGRLSKETRPRHDLGVGEGLDATLAVGLARGVKLKEPVPEVDDRAADGWSVESVGSLAGLLGDALQVLPVGRTVRIAAVEPELVLREG
jgi:hypothetical protein